ncbi:MAG: hypothetical protein RIB67_03850 [Miltoncostaeaceae bacterium]
MTDTPDCDALDQEAARLEGIAAERQATADQTREDAARLDAELLALAHSWAGDRFTGDDWRDYDQQLLEEERAAGSALDEIEREEPGRSPAEIEADLDDAWEEIGRLSDEYLDVHADWERAMAQISGDEGRDMSQPLGDLMDHASDLRDQLDGLDRQIQDLFASITALNDELATTEADGAAREAAEARWEAAQEASLQWDQASKDVKAERGDLHPEVAARAADAAAADARTADATWERKCAEGF